MGAIVKGEYLRRMREAYGRMGRRGRTRLLNQFCEVCGCHRKHAIRVLGAEAEPPGRRGGRKVVYGAAEAEALRVLWLEMGQPCSRLLAPSLGLWLPFWEAENARLPREVREGLLAMSPATMDRLLRPHRVEARRARGHLAAQAAALRAAVPVRTRFEDADRPGYIEADGVAHCGGSMAGDFVWTLTLTDVWSGWTEQRAVWNRGAHGVLEAVRAVEARLPFALIGFDCDNGPEFLNHHLRDHLIHRPNSVKMTRSRPYMSNDNAHVEQKNWTHARQLLGYGRLADPGLVGPINALLILWDDLQNFFKPTLKLASKQRDGARVHRTYEAPKTPFERILDCPHVDDKTKAALKARFGALNPLDLNRRIETALADLHRAVRGEPPAAGESNP